MPKKTLLKVFAVLAVLAIGFASFTTLGGDDTVSGSAAGLPAVSCVSVLTSAEKSAQPRN